MNANYCFIYVDVGNYRSNNDSGVFLNSQMVKDLKEWKWTILNFLVGDELFPLQEWLIKPYSKSALTSESKLVLATYNLLGKTKQIFNYHQSRARQVIENAFGLLVSSWRIFREPREASPEKVGKYTLVAIDLHNYFEWNRHSFLYPICGVIDSEDSSGKIKEESWRGVCQHEGAQTMNTIPKIPKSRTKYSM